MNHDAIADTLAHAETLWPGRINASHHEAAYQAWERLPLRADGARLALNALASEFKGYLTLAHLTERLVNAAYGARGHAVSSKDRERDARNAANSEHASQVASDDAATLRWLSHLDQQDIDELARHIAETCGPIGKALLDLPGGVTKAHAMERPNVRALLHAAERQLDAKFREAA